MAKWLITPVALAVAISASPSTAATYTFEGIGDIEFFAGTFLAEDINNDGAITTPEVTAYDAQAIYNSLGPGQWGFGIDSDAPGGEDTFFQIDYIISSSTLNTLSFGFSREQSCVSFPSGVDEGETRTVARSATVSGTTTTLFSLGDNTGSFPSPYCDSYSVTPWVGSVEQTVSVINPIPLPAGFPLLAAGLGLLAFLRRRKA